MNAPTHKDCQRGLAAADGPNFQQLNEIAAGSQALAARYSVCPRCALLLFPAALGSGRPSGDLQAADDDFGLNEEDWGTNEEDSQSWGSSDGEKKAATGGTDWGKKISDLLGGVGDLLSNNSKSKSSDTPSDKPATTTPPAESHVLKYILIAAVALVFVVAISKHNRRK